MATQWAPDTCNCTLLVDDWDTASATVEYACPEHAHLPPSAVMAQVYHAENKPKNITLESALAALPEGPARDAAREGASFGFSVADRALELVFENLTASQHAQVAAAARQAHARVIVHPRGTPRLPPLRTIPPGPPGGRG